MILNTRQKNAIMAKEKRVLCLSAAGSGKTRVLTERIKYLLEQGVEPKQLVAITYTNMAAEEVKKRLSDNAKGAFIGTIHGYANYLCNLNGVRTADCIEDRNFDELIKRATRLRNYPVVDHLLIDEFQDTSPLEYTFLNTISPTHFFAIGDERQCQPEGTKVKLKNGVTKNIEDIKVGDSVVWYDCVSDYMSDDVINNNSSEVLVKKVGSRLFRGKLITIETESGEQSTYTPNHICFARCVDFENPKYFVVLGQDSDDNFQIGTTSSCGFKGRFKPLNENWENGWVLKVFDNQKDAKHFEQFIRDEFYGELENCLDYCNRELEYPLATKTDDWVFGLSSSFEIRACNLMSEIMAVIVYDKNEPTRQKTSTIKTISVRRNTKENPIVVYSLETENETYVADNILTHNCIFQFSGSSDEFIKNLFDDVNFTKYFLTENYRNAPNIIRFAENFLSSEEKLSPPSMAKKVENARIEECGVDDALDDLAWSGDWGAWFVLARTNGEIAELENRLMKRDIPYVSFKKGDLDVATLDILMNTNKVKLLTIHSAKGLEASKVVVVGAKRFNLAERKICYVAATRAEHVLYWCPALKVKKGSYKNNNAQKKIGKSKKYQRFEF